MMYEKPEVEVVKFEAEGFMTGSTGGPCAGYSDGHGHTCGTYSNGSCASWTSTGFGGTSCASYDGTICSGYTDNRYPASNPCKTYSYKCSKF